MGLNGVSRMDRVRGDRANPQKVYLCEEIFGHGRTPLRGEEVQAYTHGRSGDRANRQRGEGEGEAPETQESIASPLFRLPKKQYSIYCM